MKNTTLKELLDAKEFTFGSHEPLADKIERNCYLICIFTGILTSISYLSFHPIFGNDNLPSSVASNFNGVFFHISILLIMIFMIYGQIFPIYFAFYVETITCIHFLRLRDYIEKHLLKNYESFDIIYSTSEQDLIYEHLKKCTKYHRLLRE